MNRLQATKEIEDVFVQGIRYFEEKGFLYKSVMLSSFYKRVREIMEQVDAAPEEETKMSELKAPPLGIMPELIHIDRRQVEIEQAVERLIESNPKSIYLKWFDEYIRNQERIDEIHEEQKNSHTQVVYDEFTPWWKKHNDAVCKEMVDLIKKGMGEPVVMPDNDWKQNKLQEKVNRTMEQVKAIQRISDDDVLIIGDKKYMNVERAKKLLHTIENMLK